MILVLGGVKSGKSSFASAAALDREQSGLGPVTYLATARAGDDEMKHRILHHQRERPATWITVEEPEKPYLYFNSCTARSSAGASIPELDSNSRFNSKHPCPRTILLDCITLWLTNLLAPMGEHPDRSEAFRITGMETEKLISAILGWEESLPVPGGQTFLVSNLVETGLISPWPLGRIFQDIAGLTHQRIAAASSEVYLLTAGIPQRIK